MTDEADRDLFRAMVGRVIPLSPSNLAPPHKSTPKHFPAPQTNVADALPDDWLDFTAGDVPAEFLSNGCSRQTLRKLRTHLSIDMRLDLHGYLSDAARRVLQQFLHDALHQNMRCVLVIHGKGLNSRDGEAVLKLRTRHWLMQHRAVLAYCDAPPNEGGSGAVRVLLRSAARVVVSY